MEIQLERVQAPIPGGGGQTHKVWRAAYSCNLCRDIGAVMAFHKTEPGAPYAFRCDCQIGQLKGFPYPKWHTGRLKEYDLSGGADKI